MRPRAGATGKFGVQGNTHMSTAPQTTCYVPQELQAAVDWIMPLIHQYRSDVLTAEKPLELEVRLGRRHKVSQRWDSEVSGSFFLSTLEMLQGFAGWSVPPATVHMHDYFYVVPATDASSEPRRIRTTMQFGSPCTVTHVCKTLVGLRDLKLVDHSCDARVSLKQELPVKGEELPDVVVPTHVRIKRRTSFFLDRWRFDLTQVWRGASRSEAEESQASGQCVYEVEAEFTGDRAYVASVTDQYMATSLLLKLCSVLGSGVIYMLPLSAARA